MTIGDGSGEPASARAVGRGARVTVVGQLIRTGCNLASLVLLARLLSPHDYGIVAMAAVVIGLGEVLRDMGLSTAAVQAATLDDRQRSNLFWISTLIGAAFMLTVILIAPALALFYGDSSVAPVASVLATTFLINGLSAQHRANANRQMKFGRLAWIDTAPPLCALLIAIVLASYGFGVWALVAQQILTVTIGLVLAWSLIPWRPRLPSRDAGTRKFVNFGIPLVGAQLLGYVSRSIDTAAMGASFGPIAAGIYDRAFQIVMLPINQFSAPSTRVALPVLARNIDSPAELGRLLRRGQGALIHPVGTLLMGMVGLAPAAVPVLLGEQWRAAVPFVQVLAIGALAQTLAYSSYWAFLSYGRTGSNLGYALVSRPIVIAAILGGALLGPLWIAVGYSIGLILIWPLAFYWIRSFPGMDSAGLFRDGIMVVLTYGPAAVAAMATLALLSTGNAGAIVTLAAGIAVFAVACLAMAWVVPSARSSWALVIRRFIRA